MGTVITILLFVVGLILIIKGGDWFVDAATWIAEALKIPKFLIGATVVSFATTLPELIVSVIATLGGKNDIAVGNAVGSVTVNIGLIMALSLICIPSVINRKEFSFKGILMVSSVALLAILCLSGGIGALQGLLLIAIFIAFLIENIKSAKTCMAECPPDEKIAVTQKDVFTNVMKFIVGAIGIIVGAQLLVDNGSELARIIGVPESIIGVTVIAIGTSLPELVTTLTAISKKQSMLSVGNIVGANIIDNTLILPICAIVSGGTLPVSPQSYLLDLPVCLLVSAIAIIPTLIRKRFTRIQGILLVLVYIFYLIILCGGFINFA